MTDVNSATAISDLIDIVDDRIENDSFMERGTTLAVAAGTIGVAPFVAGGSGALYHVGIVSSEMGVGLAIGTNEIVTNDIESLLGLQKATLNAVDDLMRSMPDSQLDIGNLNSTLSQGGVPADIARKAVQLAAEHNFEVTGVIGDGWVGDNVIGDGVAYDYTLDNENPASATYDDEGRVLTSSRPVARPEDGAGFLDWLGDVTGLWPVILDLDGDGVELSNGASTQFDVDGDGYIENAFWAGADDGFLVLDLNSDGSRGAGDGVIDRIDEIAFNLWSEDGLTDLEALAQATDDQGNLIFDTNSDGILSVSDTSWAEFKIWQDQNQNGVTDVGELKSLSELGISSINLTHDENSELFDAFGATVLGNTFNGFTSYVRNGEVVTDGVADVTLAYEANGWRNVETAEGFDIEYENGEVYSSWELDKHANPNVDLVAEGLVGVRGDFRDNIITAENYDTEVSMAGGAGDDILIGGNKVDFLSGGTGSDVLKGGLGDDIYLFEAGDGQTIIDTNVFTWMENGQEHSQAGTDGFHTEYVAPAGKDQWLGGTYEWVSDTASRTSVVREDSGHDVIQFGEGISLSDIAIITDDDAEFYAMWGDSSHDLNIHFVDDAGAGFTGDEIRVEAYLKETAEKEAGISELVFSSGNSVSRIMHKEGWTGDSGDDVLAVPEFTMGLVQTGWLNGLAGNDEIIGGAGDDVLIGGKGDDVLTGDYEHWDSAGGDIFAFGNDHGNDIITDFELGKDTIVYDGEGVGRADLTLEDTNEGLLITLSDGSKITMPTITVQDIEDAEDNSDSPFEFWAA